MAKIKTVSPVIPLPASESDLKRFLEDVAQHPDSEELLHRTAGFDAEVRSRGVKDVRRWSFLRHCWDGKFAAYRQQLHVRICDRLLSEGSRTRRGNPTAVLILGPPGAGKTTVALPFAQDRLKVRLTPVNPDDVKERFPEYEGWNATPLHWESAFVAEQDLKERAQHGRYNIVYDLVGRDTAKVADIINIAADPLNYNVYVVLADLPAWMAAGRAWTRFQSNPFKRNGGKPGRYVPPNYVAEVGDTPRITFDQVKAIRGVSGYCRLDMARSTSNNPVVAESGNWPT